MASAVKGAPCQITPPGALHVPLSTTATPVPFCASPVKFMVVRARWRVEL